MRQTNPEREQKEETKQSRWGFRGMTVRGWLELLIVPLALVLIGFLFTMQQDARQQRIEDQRARQAQEIENQRAAAERKLAEQSAQDEALQAYLDQMGQLMLDRKLLDAEQGDPVHTLAQARTSTVILRLDAQHNESVTRFLIDSGLAERSEDSPRLLRGITLRRAALSGAYLPNADLNNADLSGANLSRAELSGADLSKAVLFNTDLNGADLSSANLSKTGLFKANLSDAGLPFAHLSGAGLSDANLSGADLFKANLNEAVLFKANLSGANLEGANLNDAQGITNEELEQQAASLEGATMPNGQKYEEWLKDREDRK